MSSARDTRSTAVSSQPTPVRATRADRRYSVLPAPDVQQRQRDIENTLGSLRIEGFELDEAARDLLARYVAGEITFEDVGAVLTRHP